MNRYYKLKQLTSSYLPFFRHPKTQNERRAAFAVEIDGMVVKPRAKRTAGMLPTLWDDIQPIHELNWKSYRKTQYRLK
jgi:hypothetical protein